MTPAVYIDTSAAVKLLVEEPESAALAETLDAFDPYACDLVETELRRYAVRWSLPQEDVSRILDGFNLVELDRAAFREAGLLPFEDLRSHDSLHLVAASRMDVSSMFCYDSRMIAAARALGLEVCSPGRAVAE